MTLDEALQKQVQSWRAPFEKYAAEVIGETVYELDQTTCQQQDCLLGQVLGDFGLDTVVLDQVDEAAVDRRATFRLRSPRS